VDNATHDGQIFSSPLELSNIDKEKYVYEKLIDNSYDENLVLDLRVCVIGNEIPVVWKKFRKKDTRFSNENFRVELGNVVDEFSESEISKIIEFSKSMGLDIGELDILRSRVDGEIYIVDVNRTAHAPPSLQEGITGIRAMHAMAAAFRRQFLV